MVDLRTLVLNGSNLTLGEAFFIYDSGEILVRGFLPNGDEHGVVLIPCDEKHPGECEDYSMIEVATPQINTPKAGSPATMKQGTGLALSPVDRFRSQMRQRFQIPGQPPAPRD